MIAAVYYNCLAVLILGADAQWEKYSSPDKKFTVSLPGKPERKSHKVSELTVYSVKADLNPFHRFSIYHFDSALPAAELQKPEIRDKVLDAGRQMLGQNLEKSKLKKEEKIMLGKHPGRSLAFEYPNKDTVNARVYLVGSRLYVLAAHSRGGKPVAKADVNRFFGSFKVAE